MRARHEERELRGGGPVAGGTDFKREENALEKMELRRRTEKEQERTRGRGGRGEKKRFQRIPGLDGELGVCVCVFATCFSTECTWHREALSILMCPYHTFRTH